MKTSLLTLICIILLSSCSEQLNNRTKRVKIQYENGTRIVTNVDSLFEIGDTLQYGDEHVVIVK